MDDQVFIEEYELKTRKEASLLENLFDKLFCCNLLEGMQKQI